MASRSTRTPAAGRPGRRRRGPAPGRSPTGRSRRSAARRGELQLLDHPLCRMITCALEPRSTRTPGHRSTVETAPPRTSSDSTTSTRRPARARWQAATRPLWPEPMTTASTDRGRRSIRSAGGGGASGGWAPRMRTAGRRRGSGTAGQVDEAVGVVEPERLGVGVGVVSSAAGWGRSATSACSSWRPRPRLWGRVDVQLADLEGAGQPLLRRPAVEGVAHLVVPPLAGGTR